MPPDTKTLAAPLLPPLQDTFVWEAALAAKAGGCVMVKVLVAVQLFPSVTVQVQVPTDNPVTEAVPSPVGFPGDQS